MRLGTKVSSRLGVLVFWSFFLPCSDFLYGQNCQYLSEAMDETRIDSYRQFLTKHLVTSRGDYGTFVMMPSRRAEWGLTVTTVPKSQQGSKKFRLSLVSATDSLYEANFSLHDVNTSVSVSQVGVEIDKTFALAIQRAWRAILSKDPTPSDNPPPLIMDGYSAELSVEMSDGHVIVRGTSNPRAAPAAEIVRLGHDLRGYCLATPKERRRIRAQIVGSLHTFAERLEKENATCDDH